MKKRITTTLYLISLLTVLVLTGTPAALAQLGGFDDSGEIAEATKLPTADPETVTINVVQWALGFLGLIAVVMIIYGGFTWMTAAGNEERLALAKKVIKYAIGGLLVILLAWALTTFVFGRINSFTT